MYIDFVFLGKIGYSLFLFLKSHSCCFNLFEQLCGLQKYKIQRRVNLSCTYSWFWGCMNYFLWYFHWPFQLIVVFFFLLYNCPNHLTFSQDTKLHTHTHTHFMSPPLESKLGSRSHAFIAGVISMWYLEPRSLGT